MFRKRNKITPDPSATTTIIEAIANKPRRWYIPEGCIEEFYFLWDRMDKEKNHSTRYALWSFLYRVIPDLPRGLTLRIPSVDIMQPCVEEVEGEKA